MFDKIMETFNSAEVTRLKFTSTTECDLEQLKQREESLTSEQSSQHLMLENLSKKLDLLVNSSKQF